MTQDDKDKVKKAVEDANPNLPEGATIDVADDGTVTVKDKDGNVLGTISADKTVKQDETKLAVKAPEAVEVANLDQLTAAEKEAVKEAVKKANPDLADAEITVDNKGNVTVTKDGKSATLSSAQTVKRAGSVVTPATPGADNNANAAGSQGNVDKSKSSNQKGCKNANTGDASTTGILATFFASIIALFAMKRRKKDTK